MIVYIIRNAVNGKIYVGQTCQTVELRLRSHFKQAKYGRGTHFCNAIRKYGEQVFSIDPICIVRSQKDLDYFEQSLIAALDSTNRLKGYNGTVGGEHGTLSDDVKRKIGLANKGRKSWRAGRKCGPLSAAQKKKIGNFWRGKKHTPEFARKRLRWQILQSDSERAETIRRRSESLKTAWAQMTKRERKTRIAKIVNARWGKEN